MYAWDTPRALLHGAIGNVADAVRGVDYTKGWRGTGQDMLKSLGVISPQSQGLDLGGMAGMASEVALDPMNLIPLGAMMGAIKYIKNAKALAPAVAKAEDLAGIAKAAADVTPEALKGASYFQPELFHQYLPPEDIMTTMHPKEFLQLAYGFPKGKPVQRSLDNVREVVGSGTPLDAIPFLWVGQDNRGMARVLGHEGRHRATVLNEQGVTEMPVKLHSVSGETPEGVVVPRLRWREIEQGVAPYSPSVWPTQIMDEERDEILDFGIPDLRRPEDIRRMSADKTRTPEFMGWFGDYQRDRNNASKIVNPAGMPQRVYHGTTAPENFTEFAVGYPVERGDDYEFFDIGSGADPRTYLGSHFSREPNVANKFAEGLYGERQFQTEGGRVIPAYLNIREPFVTTDEDMLKRMLRGNYSHPDVDYEIQREAMERWGGDIEPAYKLYDMDPVAREEINQRALEIGAQADEPDFSLSREMAETYRGNLQNKGYDGIIYENQVEGGLSYVAFQPQQIKSATANSGEFNPASPNFLRAILPLIMGGGYAASRYGEKAPSYEEGA
jgi:hypothetical protein